MPYSQILGESFRIIRRQPVLWLLGFLVTLCGGGGSYNLQFDPSMFEDVFGTEDLSFDPLASIPDHWFSPEWLVLFLLVGACLVILMAFLFLFLRSAALAALIVGTERAAGGTRLRFRELLRHGLSFRGMRIALLTLLLALPPLILVLASVLLFLLSFLPMIRALTSGHDVGAEAIGAVLFGLAIFIPLMLIAVALGWLLHLIGVYGARFVALEDATVGGAFRQGWRLFRDNIVSSVVFSILLAVIQMVISFLLGIMLAIIFMVLLVAFIPLAMFLSTALFEGVIVLLGLAAILGAVLIASLVTGPLVAYIEAAWTVTWHYLRDDGETAPVAAE